MNRIYQGRVSSLQIIDPSGTPRDVSIGDPSTCPLWWHHRVFQDAVNYYLLAFGALASADAATSNRVILDLRTRLAESWESFPRPNSKGKCGLRESVRSWLGLGSDSTIEEAYEVILTGQDTDSKKFNGAALDNLLRQLLEKGGDGKIRNGGATELPKFCSGKTNANFSGEHARKALGRLRLILTLHGQMDGNLAEFGALDLATASKRSNRSNSKGEDARKKLVQFVGKLLKAGWITKDLAEELNRNVRGLPGEDILEIPAYEAGGESREKSIGIPMLLLGKQFGFPEWSKAALRQLLAMPQNWEKALEESSKAVSEGADPLELARGERGFVFRAFTALPAWNPVGPGEPAWKEFDIAAFKEALKALNQFKQKTEEREATRLELEARQAWMLGTGGHGGDEDEKLPVLGGDPRFRLAVDLERDLTDRLMLDASNPFTISRASLRGFRDLAERWNQAKTADPEKLQGILKAYQADPKNQREIGSVPLMLALCEADYHPLWREADEEEKLRRESERRPADILAAMCRFHQLRADLTRAGQPIRLTPAEPEASRRLYMFSDLSGRSASKFKGTELVEVSLAVQQEGAIRECRAVIGFSAPRLKRDELTGGESSRWIQPMTAALNLAAPPLAGAFDSAVALMPKMIAEDKARKVRHLLNFPVSLEPAWIHAALGKAAIWKGQFNGTKDNNLHLHWPGTEKDATKKNRWWENPAVIDKGFTVLSNDLGQRSAGAWALLRVTCWRPDTKRPVRMVGNDGVRTWFAEVLKTGMHRLPGEETLELKGAERIREPYGAKGRLAMPEEHGAALRIAADLGIREPEKWLGEAGEKSFPELNDDLLKIANRRLSRLGTYHRWSCFDPGKIEIEAKREKAVENLRAELDSYQDEEVRPWKEVAAAGDFAAFRNETGRAFVNLRDQIERVLVNLANLTVPVRRKLWDWRMRGGGSVYGDLILEDFTDANPKVRGQRGLSMRRLEQLENLRRVFLRYNRSLDRAPGEPAKFGRDDRGRDSGEPCQELLDKIERMKEQRVNQTAHLILAQALGVRLKAHSLPDRGTRDIHGEYERIDGREPVDFIVIEDLNRYKASQGRAPSENRGLMKWAHRAVRDKLKMLSEEPFGIPVVEVAAAYTSRFCGRTGESGARCVEIGLLQGFDLASVERKGDLKPAPGRVDLRAQFQSLLEQFATIKDENAATTAWNKTREREAKAKPIKTLLLPRPGGPLFLNIRDGQPVQADLNAAINIGLRAIAAPGTMDLIHRVRAIREGEQPDFCWRPRHSEKEQANARERAAFNKASSIRLRGEVSSRFVKTASPNFFFEKSPSFTVDTGMLVFDGRQVPVVSGIALHSQCDGFVLDRILEINNGRLKAWGLPTVRVTSKCARRGEASKQEEPDDDIPI